MAMSSGLDLFCSDLFIYPFLKLSTS